MLTLDKDPLSLAVSPLFWEKKKKLNQLECPSEAGGRVGILEKYSVWCLTLGCLESANFALLLKCDVLSVAGVRCIDQNTLLGG